MKFADTSFWFAVQERRDARHQMARELAATRRGKVLTSDLIVGETWTLLRRRSGHFAAVGFLDRLGRLSDVEVAHIDEDAVERAWRWLRIHSEKEYSFVDATSFVIMKRRKIREALAFDGDFSSAGFIEVRP